MSITSKNIEPIYKEERKGDIRHSNADISKAKEYLGYDPEYSMEKGLEFTIDWYKDNL